MDFGRNKTATGLLIVNLIYLLFGLSALVVGIIDKIYYGDVMEQLNVREIQTIADFLTIVPLLFIIVGAVVCAIAACGCFGVRTENLILIKLYQFTLISILGCLSLIMLLAYTYQPILETLVKAAISNLFQTYNSSENSQELLDLMQNQLYCCGVTSYMDFKNDQAWQQHSQESSGKENSSIPASCCKKPDDPVLKICYLKVSQMSNVHKDGCSPKLWHIMENSSTLITISAAVLSVLLIMGVLFSCCLSHQYEDGVFRSYGNEYASDI